MELLAHELLSEAAAAEPQQTAVRGSGTSWTYGRLESVANAVAWSLLELGVRRGDRVGILLPRRPEAIAAIYAVLKAGAVYVPLDPLAPVPYLATLASDCTMSALVTNSARAAQLVPALMERPLRPVKGVLLTDRRAPVEGLPIPSRGLAETDATLVTVPPSPASHDDTACLLYTSGSTGTPKGVMHSHRALVAGARWFCRNMGVRSTDVIFAHAPLHFILSLYGIFAPPIARATSVLISLERAFRGVDLARLVGREKVTVWVSVPFPLRSLLSSGLNRGSISSLRTVMCGGGSLTGSDISTLRRLIPRAQVWQVYGSTEAAAVCCGLVEEASEAHRPVSIGRPIEDARVLIMRADGGEAGPGEHGELYVQSPRVMQGYWGDPQRTAEALVSNPLDEDSAVSFYRSGDVVKVQQDGRLEYVKRLDQMVKSRGHRIELSEVEAVLNSHAAAQESVALPLPHSEWGVAIAACVMLREGQVATEAQLKSHVAARLPSYLVPHRIEVVAELPRTSSGKVDRRRLKARFDRAVGRS